MIDKDKIIRLKSDKIIKPKLHLSEKNSPEREDPKQNASPEVS